jgi:taurine dioxygenase
MNERVNPSVARPLVSQRSGVTVRRVGVNLGAEISGVDLRYPLPDAQCGAVKTALVENELIIFRNQEITSEQLMAFGRGFGELTVHPFAPNEGKNAPELIKFRNDESTPPFGTDVWHSDETFRAEPPMATVLCAKEVPSVGGDTMFVSMSAAFDGLSDRMQRYICGLVAIHDMKPFRPLFGQSLEDRKKLQQFELMYPPQLHPIVRVHPVSRRKVLFVNPQFTIAIEGMEECESRSLLDTLFHQALIP